MKPPMDIKILHEKLHAFMLDEDSRLSDIATVYCLEIYMMILDWPTKDKKIFIDFLSQSVRVSSEQLKSIEESF